MSHTFIVRSLQVLTNILAIYGIWYTFNNDVSYYVILSIFLYYFLGLLGINIGFHRYLSHNSFKTNKFFHYLMTFSGTLTAMGSPIGWVSVHRQHHRCSDREGDPHSPLLLGTFKTWFGFWGNFKIREMCRDLRRDPIQKFIHNYYGTIHLTYIGILLLINPLLVLYAYAIPAALIFHSAGIFDVIAHKHGYISHETNDNSRNSWLSNLVSLGEGWHNNHHASPLSWSTQEKWWELDPAGWIIKLIRSS